MNHESTKEVAVNASGTLPAASSITLKVNGTVKQIEVRPWVTLLDLLRERLDLTGTKKDATTENAELARFWSTVSASTPA